MRVWLLLLLLAGEVCAQDGAPLSRAAAAAEVQRAWQGRREVLRGERQAEMAAKTLELAGQTMRWEDRVYGEEPVEGHSL